MILKDVLDKSKQFLVGKGIESSRIDSELLLSHALGWERIQLYLKFDYPLSEDEVKRCREFIVRRGQGEPVAYIIQKIEVPWRLDTIEIRGIGRYSLLRLGVPA